LSSDSVSVVVPVYRNEEHLDELCRRLDSTLRGMDRRFEVILVDDGSPDRSWEVIQELAGRSPEIVGFRLSRNFGQHAAIAAGFERADGDLTVLMDADLQDEPEHLPALLRKLDEGADVVYTVNIGGDQAGFRGATSMLFHYSFSKLTSFDVPQSIGTYRAFNRAFREAVLSYPERRALYGPLMLSMGFRAAFVPVTRRRREGGKSGYTFASRLTLAIETLVSYTNVPHKVLVFTGFVISLLSASYLVALIVDYLVEGPAFANGLTLLIGMTLFLMGAVLMSLGVVGTYVFRVFQEVLNRPRYLLAEQVDKRPLGPT
jgi:glycosyltransferase involved in cell wall biosynthesis